MSGIAGVITADGAPPDAGLLEHMSEALAFRGPDGRFVWKRPGAGLCFTYLRTGPAPQAEKQPLTLDDRVWLIADARLDGRESLRNRLTDKACALPAEPTDEELILHAWRLWGPDSLENLRGDFAFALWDASDGSVWCARDPIGVKPFYYAHAEHRFCFSNTLDVVRLAPWVSEDLDPRAVGDFLLEGWCPDPDRTIFREIRRVPAGQLLHFSGGHLDVHRYARLPIEEPQQLKRPADYVEAFLEIFGAAVRDRLPRTSAALMMSGGLDSTSVAAVAKSLVEKDNTGCALRAFTIDYRPLFDDEEGLYASRAAAHIGIPHEMQAAGACRPYARWESEQLHPPEPCHEPFLALQLHQYRQTAAHARVALSGDGGDDVLMGQAWPQLLSLTKRRDFGALIRVFGGYLLSHGRIPPLRGGFRSRLQKWIGRNAGEEALYPSWFNPTFEREQNLLERWHALRQTPPRDGFLQHPFHPRAYAGLNNSFWPSILEQEDAAWTGVALELRAPFFDWRVLRFLLRLPPLPWCMEKELLRRSMLGRLPDEIRLRPKAPLREDPLTLHVRRGSWHPTPLPPAVPAIELFVSWTKVEAALAASAPDQLWSHLRPISLNYWLKTKLGIGKVRSGDTG